MKPVVALHQYIILPLQHLTPMQAVAHRHHHMLAIHHTVMVLQYLILLPITILSSLLHITVLQAIQLITVVLHSTHMVHMPVIAVQVGILFASLLSIIHILNF